MVEGAHVHALAQVVLVLVQVVVDRVNKIMLDGSVSMKEIK